METLRGLKWNQHRKNLEAQVETIQEKNSKSQLHMYKIFEIHDAIQNSARESKFYKGSSNNSPTQR